MHVLRIPVSEVLKTKLQLISQALTDSDGEEHSLEEVAQHAIAQGTDELGRLFFDYIAERMNPTV